MSKEDLTKLSEEGEAGENTQNPEKFELPPQQREPHPGNPHGEEPSSWE